MRNWRGNLTNYTICDILKNMEEQEKNVAVPIRFNRTSKNKPAKANPFKGRALRKQKRLRVIARKSRKLNRGK